MKFVYFPNEFSRIQPAGDIWCGAGCQNGTAFAENKAEIFSLAQLQMLKNMIVIDLCSIHWIVNIYTYGTR